MQPRSLHAANSFGDGSGTDSKSLSIGQRASSSSVDEWISVGRHSVPQKPSACSFGSGSSTDPKTFSLLQRGSASSTEEWVAAGRKAMAPKSVANFKSLNEAIRAERELSRQKIINAEEKILELEHKLILKEKECCDLKEKLLFEHQRPTMEMAPCITPTPTFYPDPTAYPTSYSEPIYSSSSYAEPSYAESAYSEPVYAELSYPVPSSSYDSAVQNGWSEFPGTGSIPSTRSQLSAEAKEFSCDAKPQTDEHETVEEVVETPPAESLQPKTAKVNDESDSEPRSNENIE